MKRFLFCVCLMVAVLMGCKSDDDANLASTDPLEGQWSLVEISGGFTGGTQRFDSGVLAYTFLDGTLTVENYNTDPTVFIFLDSGTYPYELTEQNNANRFTLDGAVYAVDTLESNIFVFNDMVSDGFTYTLER